MIGRPKLNNAETAAKFFHEVFPKGQISLREIFLVAMLNRLHHPIGVAEVSRGGVNAVLVDPKLVFLPAIKLAATSIIVCHNHPSGNTYASTADRKITDKLSVGGKMLDMPLLDHIIITPQNGYYSFANDGGIS